MYYVTVHNKVTCQLAFYLLKKRQIVLTSGIWQMFIWDPYVRIWSETQKHTESY